MKIDVINLNPSGLPKYAKAGDSGMDALADLSRGWNEDMMVGCAYDEVRKVMMIFSGGRMIVPTGLFTAFPPGYEIQIRSRSGLTIKFGVVELNSPGTIDSNYRGEIGLIIANMGDEVFEFSQGDRLAQLVLAKVSLIEWNEVDQLPESNRGQGGYGSTGK